MTYDDPERRPTAEVRLAVLETRQLAYDAAMLDIKHDLHEIKEIIGHYRPPWSVVIIITSLVSLVTALIVQHFA